MMTNVFEFGVPGFRVAGSRVPEFQVPEFQSFKGFQSFKVPES